MNKKEENILSKEKVLDELWPLYERISHFYKSSLKSNPYHDESSDMAELTAMMNGIFRRLNIKLDNPK